MYATALCFCIVSSYESKRQVEYTEKKLKESKVEKVKKMITKEDQLYENEFDIVAIVEYLSEKGCYLLDELDRLEKIACKVVS